MQGRRRWEAGSGVLCCLAASSHTPHGDAAGGAPEDVLGRTLKSGSAWPLPSVKGRGPESKREHSNTTRVPPTGRNGNGRSYKIIAAEGSEERQVDRQDYESNFRTAWRYYLDNNK